MKLLRIKISFDPIAKPSLILITPTASNNQNEGLFLRPVEKIVLAPIEGKKIRKTIHRFCACESRKDKKNLLHKRQILCGVL